MKPFSNKLLGIMTGLCGGISFLIMGLHLLSHNTSNELFSALGNYALLPVAYIICMVLSCYGLIKGILQWKENQRNLMPIINIVLYGIMIVLLFMSYGLIRITLYSLFGNMGMIETLYKGISEATRLHRLMGLLFRLVLAGYAGLALFVFNGVLFLKERGNNE